MASFDKSLLDLDEDSINKELLIENLEKFQQGSQKPNYKTVLPKPGFCLKTKTDKNEKIFINVCTGENLPAPKEITDEELMKLLESEDPSGYRVPMSLGEPHAEVDKSGAGCTAYDVVVNPTFYEEVQKRQLLLGFFLTIVLEGIEYKYNMTLSRNWVVLKNRKFLGSLPEQNIRTESKPWIMEMEGNSDKPATPSKAGGLITEISSQSQEKEKPRAPEPPYTIIQEPPEDHPEYLVAEIHLPKVKAATSLTLDIGEDRILLQTRSNVYHLDIFLPYNVIQEDCGAQFDRKSKIMTLTMPVQPL